MSELEATADALGVDLQSVLAFCDTSPYKIFDGVYVPDLSADAHRRWYALLKMSANERETALMIAQNNETYVARSLRHDLEGEIAELRKRNQELTTEVQRLRFEQYAMDPR